MKILIIAPYYHPYINPRAHRWTVIAEQWAATGHEVQVICSKRGGLAATETRNGVAIYRTGYNSLKEVFYNWFGIKKRRGEAAPTVAAKPASGWINRLLVWFNNRFWRQVYFPDDACVWHFPARRKALQLLASGQFDALVSVSLPFTAHWIGLACKKRFPNLRWLADSGDPFSLQSDFSPPNNPFLYRRWSRILEKTVLSSADVATVTVRQAKELYEREFSLPAGKVHVIPPIGSFDGLRQKNLPLHLPKGKIHLGYFGSFFKKIREPEVLLQLLRQVQPSVRERWEVHFFGDIFENFLPVFDRYADLKNMLRFHGLVAREAVSDALSQMDVLVNLGNATTFQLPSKCADYLLSGKPVANLCAHDDDTFAEFMNDHPLLLNLVLKNGQATAAQAAQLVQFIENEKGKRVGEEWLAGRAAEISAARVSAEYLRLLRTEK
jgi:hypothetical protein